MSETTMPAAEAVVAPAHDDERGRYELAFHVLPTVAEGEVSGVVDSIKTLITKAEGEIFDEEAPERFDLAYEIVEHIEGKNRKFASAYFGWIRFSCEPDKVEAITHEVNANASVLRSMTVRLTREEDAHPFRFHEALAAQKQVTNVDEAKPAPASTEEAPKAEAASDDAKEEKAEAAPEKSEA